MRVTALLAARAARTHRKAWAAVFAALVLTSALLGAFAVAVTSAALGHARVERYAAADAVVAGDQNTRYTAKPWGSEPETATAGLTERVRVPERALDVIRKVPGVRLAVADRVFPVGTGTTTTTGRPWAAARLAPYALRDGRSPHHDREVVVGGDHGLRDRVTLRVGTTEATYRVVGVAEGPRAAVYFTGGEARRLAGVAGADEGVRHAGAGVRHAGDAGAVGGAGDAGAGADKGAWRAGRGQLDARRTGSGRVGSKSAGAAGVVVGKGVGLGGGDTGARAVDAIGVVADDGVSVGEVYGRVRAAVDEAGLRSVGERADGDSAKLRVLTGRGKGAAEYLAVAPARTGMLELLGAVAGTVVLIALLVVSSTVVQALRQRAHELGLLRAVGATPRQLRGAVGREVGRVAAVASMAGAVLAVPAYLGLRALLEAHDALPPGLELPLPPWLWAAPLVTAGLTVLVARISALIACGRTAKVRPAEALREAEPGTPRRITGLVLLAVGVTSAGTATLQHGQAAAAAASASAVSMVIGCALLGPWIAHGALRVLAGPMRRLGGPSGHLAAANCTASAGRLGAAITPIVLVTAFVGVQLTAGATLTHEAAAQLRDAVRADLVVRADTGLPAGAVARIRAAPGVRAATEVVHSTVVLARRETGEPRLDRLPVLGVTAPGVTRALDPDVSDGRLDGLRPGTVAVSRDRARDLDARVGSTVTLRFGDGAEAGLKVVAVYERGLGAGDFLLSRDELTRHMSGGGPAARRVLVTTDGAGPGPGPGPRTERALAAAAPGARIERGAGAVRDVVRVEAEDQALGGVVSGAVVAAIGGFTVIAVLSTLTLIGVGRRPELALLRRAGAGRAQLRRMLRLEAAATALTGLVVGTGVALFPLLAFSVAVAGAVPYLPFGQGAVVVAVVGGTALAGTVLPARRALRGRYPTG
ncbi:FtsX-like permease family protein [Streptomyces sp. NPDC059063]|uniref:FtsX-like permease family protein n=1 Tax=unclassified Streptomyces TaxID=2593676 RepID=UPI00368195AE